MSETAESSLQHNTLFLTRTRCAAFNVMFDNTAKFKIQNAKYHNT